MSRHHIAKIRNRRWERVRLEVLERDGWRCRSCSRPGKLEVDHVRRLEDGGAVYDLDNLQALCSDCHRAKTAAENSLEPPEVTAERRAWAAYCRSL